MKFIMLDDLKKNKKRAILFFAAIGAVQYIVLTFIAMLFYPRPYNFFLDTFSSLGLTDANISTFYFYGSLRIPPGPPLPNPVSPILFILALIIAAIAMIPFWIILPSLFKEKENTKYISWVGSISGVVSSPFLMGVGFPADIFLQIHATSTQMFFLLFAIAIMIYTIVIFLHGGDYPKSYAYFGVIVGIVAVLYVFLPFTGLNALHQKIAVYLFIAWPLVQAFEIWNRV